MLFDVSLNPTLNITNFQCLSEGFRYKVFSYKDLSLLVSMHFTHVNQAGTEVFSVGWLVVV